MSDRSKESRLKALLQLLDAGGLQSQRAVVAIDLGHHFSKAVHVEKHGRGWKLLGQTQLPSPLHSKSTPDDIARHIGELHRILGAKTKFLALVLSAKEAVLRLVEMPDASVPDLRQMLKFNAVRYLQQDFKDYVYDCQVTEQQLPASAVEGAGATGTGKRKHIMVAGIPSRILEDLRTAATKASLQLGYVTLAQIGLVNAGAAALDDLLEQQVCGFLDIGHEQATLSIMSDRELVFSRGLPIGASTITRSLADSLNITPQVAEGLKTTMLDKVKEKLARAMVPLAEQVRASVDFFEEKHQRVVTKILVSGGEAKSGVTVRLLHEELIAPPCDRWNPVSCLLSEDGESTADVVDSAVFGPAVGVAIAALGFEGPSLNLLAEHLEREAEERRDPVRRTIFISSCLAAVLVVIAGMMFLRVRSADQEVARMHDYIESTRGLSVTMEDHLKKRNAIEHTMTRLHKQATRRFLWAGPLDALQQSMLDGIEVSRLQIIESLSHSPAVKPERDIDGKLFPGKPAANIRKMTLTIAARDYGQPPVAEQFISALQNDPYFQSQLRPLAPVRLKDRQSRHVDADDTAQSYIPFTVECVFNELSIVDE